MCYKFYVNFLSKLRNKQTFQLICLQKNLSQEIIPVRNKYFKEKKPLHCHSVSVERSRLYYVSDFWIIRETDNVSFGVNNDCSTQIDEGINNKGQRYATTNFEGQMKSHFYIKNSVSLFTND